MRVKVAQVAPRERAKNLDPCARVRKLARWCDELVAMASTEMKFTIIRLQRRSREVRQTVQLSRRRMCHSLHRVRVTQNSSSFVLMLGSLMTSGSSEYSFSLHLLSCAYLWPFCGQNSHKLPLLATFSGVHKLTLRVS